MKPPVKLVDAAKKKPVRKWKGKPKPSAARIKRAEALRAKVRF